MRVGKVWRDMNWTWTNGKSLKGGILVGVGKLWRSACCMTINNYIPPIIHQIPLCNFPSQTIYLIVTSMQETWCHSYQRWKEWLEIELHDCTIQISHIMNVTKVLFKVSKHLDNSTEVARNKNKKDNSCLKNKVFRSSDTLCWFRSMTQSAGNADTHGKTVSLQDAYIGHCNMWRFQCCHITIQYSLLWGTSRVSLFFSLSRSNGSKLGICKTILVFF